MSEEAAVPEYPAHWEADVVLADGRPVHLRPIRPQDGPALQEFHRSLSAQSVYFRFFAPKPELSQEEIRRFTQVDYRDRVALVAVAGTGSRRSGSAQSALIGIGAYDRIDDSRAEVAFSVRDDAQGRGLGSVFLEHLAAAARECGITRFTAEVLPSNARMLATFRQAGFTLTARLEEDVVAVSFDIEPTERSRSVIAAREHRAEARSLDRLLHPGAIAVIGASRRVGSVGHALLQHLVTSQFSGALIAVHPQADQLLGVPCVASLRQAPGSIDLAVVAVPAPAVAEVLTDAAAAGVLGLVVVSGGFADAGPEGVQAQRALVAQARLHGLRIVGPNALGVINTDPVVRMNASLVPALPERGRVGFFCQSGALGSSILERLRARGLGVSTFVSAGNRADVSGNDLLQYWQDDEDTDLVLMYLESLGNARKFARLVRRIAPTKPVLMVGSPGAAVPSGHLARTSGLGEQAVAGLLAACGLITLDRVDQMLDLAAVLSCQPMPGSQSVAIVGNSDALGVLAMNAVARHGGSVSGQPVTFPRDATVARYRQQVQQALDRSDVGVVLAIHVPPVEGIDDADLLPQLAAVGAAAGKPVVAVMQGTGPTTSIRSGVPVFVDVEDAISALAFLLSLARWRLEGADEPVPAEGADPERLAEIVQEAVLADRLVLQGPQVSQVLAALGVQVSIGLPAPAASVRLRLVTDELFGPVVWASLDDPAAICLGDVAVRLAPMHPAQARQAIASLRALDTAMVGPESSDGDHLDGIADLMHRLSWLPVWVPGVVGLELTGLHWGIDGPRAAAATAHLDAEPEPMEPQARRMGAG